MHTVYLDRESIKRITEAFLKCNFHLQILTWALTFIVAYSAVALAYNGWNSHKQAYSMGAGFMLADENHCWESVQLSISPAFVSSWSLTTCKSKCAIFSKTQIQTGSLLSTTVCNDLYILTSSAHYCNYFLSCRRGNISVLFSATVIVLNVIFKFANLIYSLHVSISMSH